MEAPFFKFTSLHSRIWSNPKRIFQELAEAIIWIQNLKHSHHFLRKFRLKTVISAVAAPAPSQAQAAEHDPFTNCIVL